MRITRLRLDRWRNFTHVDLDLASRAFILGPHAAGKSNLLDAVRFLRDVARPGGGLAAAVAARGGYPRLRSLVAAAPADGVALVVAVGDDDSPPWEYGLTIGPGPAVRTETLVDPEGRSWVTRGPGEGDPARTSLEQGVAGAETVRCLLASVRDMRVVPQVVRDAARGAADPAAVTGGDLLGRIASAPAEARDDRIAGIAAALRLAVPQLEDLRFVAGADGAPHLEARQAHWRPDAVQDERDLSDGTLRIIGLLWELQEGAGRDAPGPPVLLEEPEVFLHPDVTRQLPSLIARALHAGGPSQVLATTHAGELLSDAGIGLDEVVVLTPGPDGTVARRAAEFPDVPALMDAGLDLHEALREALREHGADDLPFSGCL